MAVFPPGGVQLVGRARQLEVLGGVDGVLVGVQLEVLGGVDGVLGLVRQLELSPLVLGGVLGGAQEGVLEGAQSSRQVISREMRTYQATSQSTQILIQ